MADDLDVGEDDGSRDGWLRAAMREDAARIRAKQQRYEQRQVAAAPSSAHAAYPLPRSRSTTSRRTTTTMTAAAVRHGSSSWDTAPNTPTTTSERSPPPWADASVVGSSARAQYLVACPVLPNATGDTAVQSINAVLALRCLLSSPEAGESCQLPGCCDAVILLAGDPGDGGITRNAPLTRGARDRERPAGTGGFASVNEDLARRLAVILLGASSDGTGAVADLIARCCPDARWPLLTLLDCDVGPLSEGVTWTPAPPTTTMNTGPSAPPTTTMNTGPSAPSSSASGRDKPPVATTPRGSHPASSPGGGRELARYVGACVAAAIYVPAAIALKDSVDRHPLASAPTNHHPHVAQTLRDLVVDMLPSSLRAHGGANFAHVIPTTATTSPHVKGWHRPDMGGDDDADGGGVPKERAVFPRRRVAAVVVANEGRECARRCLIPVLRDVWLKLRAPGEPYVCMLDRPGSNGMQSGVFGAAGGNGGLISALAAQRPAWCCAERPVFNARSTAGRREGRGSGQEEGVLSTSSYPHVHERRTARRTPPLSDAGRYVLGAVRFVAHLLDTRYPS